MGWDRALRVGMARQSLLTGNPRRQPGCFALSIVSGAVAVAASAAAEDSASAVRSQLPEASIAHQLVGLDPILTARARLAEAGLSYNINYIGEVLGNPSGGFKRGAIYEGFLEVHVDADLEKLLGWRGGTAHATGYQLHGRGLTTFYAGNLNAVSNIEATPSTRLFDLWFEQALFDDKLAIRIGQLRVDYSGEFLSVGPGGIFISANYGWPSFTANNLPAGGATFPLASPGIRVKVSPNDRTTLLLGAYNDDPVGPNCVGDPQVCNAHGLEFRLSDDPFLIAELQLKYHVEGGSALPGVFKIGAFKDYGRFDSQRFDAGGLSLANPVSNGTPDKIRGNHGLYAIVEQQVLKLDADKGVFAFGRIAGLPSDRNLIDFYLEGGLNFAGMVPGRPSDVFGVAVSYSRISQDASALDRDYRLRGEPTPIRDYEVLAELTYIAQVVPGWTVQPDLQYVWHAGGHGQNESAAAGTPIDNTLVLGLRSTVNY